MENKFDRQRDQIKYGLSDGQRVVTFDPNLFEVCHTCLGQGKLNPLRSKNNEKCSLCNGKGIMERMP